MKHIIETNTHVSVTDNSWFNILNNNLSLFFFFCPALINLFWVFLFLS